MKTETTRQSKSGKWLELAILVAVLGVSALMWVYSVQDPWLLHLYYLPVVVSGFALGKRQARLLSLLCILTGTIVFVPNLNQESGGIPLLTVLAFGLWGAMLTSVAQVVGQLSDRLRTAIHELSEAHKKDVLTDGLTGAASRRCLEYELARKLSEWKRQRTPVGVLMFDIDHF
ncbi:MAG: diguanylate cyclase, partial [Planctomycetales bacterium]|nr:diguanylate cyclase [Planctomycetales bacterium]